MTQILSLKYRFKEVLQDAESLAVDIPKVWEYLGEIVAGTIKDNDKLWQLLKTGCQELAPNRRDVLFRKTVEQTGKGVAFQSVRPFFDWLGEGTEETTGS